MKIKFNIYYRACTIICCALALIFLGFALDKESHKSNDDGKIIIPTFDISSEEFCTFFANTTVSTIKDTKEEIKNLLNECNSTGRATTKYYLLSQNNKIQRITIAFFLSDYEYIHTYSTCDRPDEDTYPPYREIIPHYKIYPIISKIEKIMTGKEPTWFKDKQKTFNEYYLDKQISNLTVGNTFTKKSNGINYTFELLDYQNKRIWPFIVIIEPDSYR